MNKTSEEVELYQSFKRQLDSFVKQFRLNNTAIEMQEKELMILKQKTEDAMECFNIQMEKCQQILAKNKK